MTKKVSSHPKPNFGWKIYFFFFSLLNLGGLVAIFSPSSALFTYYHILISFDKKYIWPYYFNIASYTITTLSLIPLFLFIINRRWLPKWIWKILLFSRILFDIIGHQYEFAFFQSLLQSDFYLGLAAIGITVCLFLPSYIGHLLYAFRRRT